MTSNEKIGATIVGGVILYLLFKKPKYVIFKKEGDTSGGGGGVMPIIMPIQSTPAPTTTSTPPPTTTTPPKPTESPRATFPSCPSGQLWNPAMNKCEVIKLDAPVGGGATAKPPVNTPPPVAYDPCKTNGYGGTYDPTSNSCLVSPYCGGGTLKLDSNGKATNCSVSNPTSGGVVAFSGKVPLTLDNLLM